MEISFEKNKFHEPVDIHHSLDGRIPEKYEVKFSSVFSPRAFSELIGDNHTLKEKVAQVITSSHLYAAGTVLFQKAVNSGVDQQYLAELIDRQTKNHETFKEDLGELFQCAHKQGRDISIDFEKMSRVDLVQAALFIAHENEDGGFEEAPLKVVT